MYNKSIADRIMKFFEANPNNTYRIKDLASLVHVKKHNYSELRDTLFELVRQKRVHRHNKTYGHQIHASRPTSEPVGDQKPAKTAGREEDQTSGVRMVEGRLDATPLARNHAFAFVICEGDEEDVFISEEDVGDALHNDKVLVELAYRRGRRRHGIIRKVLERARTRFVGNLEKHRNDIYFICDDPKVHRNFLVRDLHGAQPGQKVLLSIVNWGLRTQHARPTGDVMEILGQAGDPQVEVLGVIRQYDLPLDFPKSVHEEADELPEEIPAQVIKSRLDLREQPCFTIDPISAKDYDDAIALERIDGGWRLSVHIADVGHWVKPGTALFREAENRGNSYYFPKTVIPMLPEKISNKLCSLRPNEDKLCMSVISELDKDFRVVKQSAHETVIRSQARLAYEEVDALFDGRDHEIPPHVVEQLKNLRKMNEIYNQRRRNNGCLWFDMPETEYEFDEQGFLTKLGRSSETESHKLIENCMLVANEYVATLLTKKTQATMYRIHEDPVEDKVRAACDVIQLNGFKVTWRETISKTLQGILLDEGNRDFHRVFDPLLLRTMMKARYSTEHIGHFGLAMDTYTHFTSPIRRLCDLVIHLQLKQAIGRQGVTFTASRLRELAERASQQELIAQESEREVNRVNERQFIRGHIGEEFEALIVHISKAVIIYELDEYPVRGVIRVPELEDDHYRFLPDHIRLVGRRTGKMFKLMDRARVRIDRVEDDVYVSLVQQEAPAKAKAKAVKRGRRRKTSKEA